MMKKRMKSRRALWMIVVMLASFLFPTTAHAADAEWRMMHGEQDALILGTITEETEAGFRVEVAEALWCEQDTVKGRMLPLEDVPDEMIVIIRSEYQYSYHGKTMPEVGDHIFISVDKKGDVWEQNWLVMEGSCTDSATVEFAKPENMRNSEYAWQLFVNSGGEKTNFAFDGEDILYSDGEIVFEADKYRDGFAEQDSSAQEEPDLEAGVEEESTSELMAEEAEVIESEKDTEIPIMESDSATIAIIGGADGPTSIFIAGKLGRGVRTAGFIIGILVVAGLITVGVILGKKINRKGK